MVVRRFRRDRRLIRILAEQQLRFDIRGQRVLGTNPTRRSDHDHQEAGCRSADDEADEELHHDAILPERIVPESSSRNRARVVERQTRRTQNPLLARACGFKSHLGHQLTCRDAERRDPCTRSSPPRGHTSAGTQESSGAEGCLDCLPRDPRFIAKRNLSAGNGRSGKVIARVRSRVARAAWLVGAERTAALARRVRESTPTPTGADRAGPNGV